MGVLRANKQKRLFILLLLTSMVVSAIVSYFPGNVGGQQSSSWTTLSSMSLSRGGLGLAVVADKIYAIGGTNGDSSLTITEEYNPVTNQWTTKTSMPTARSSFAIASYNNKIYVIGGSVDGSFTGNLEVYDPATNSWEAKTSMPTPRADLSASVIDGKIYLIGGKVYASSAPYYSETAINQVYDIATDTWITNTSMPIAVQGYASTVVNNKIYIIGGSKVSSTSGDLGQSGAVQIYDVQTGIWSTGKSLTNPVSYGAAVATTGFMAPTKIYYFGGYLGNHFNNEVRVYDINENSWTNSEDMPSVGGYHAVAVINDLVYVIGGYDGSNWLASNLQYKPLYYGTVPPKIQITSPVNKTYTDIEIAFTTNRVLSWAGYSLDNQANVTITDDLQVENISNGQHEIIIFANDTLGNMGSSERVFFSIDVLGPQITIIIPLNQTYSTRDIQLVFITDESVDRVSYVLDGKEELSISGNITLPALTDGSHWVTVFAVDEYGNSNTSETIFFTVSTFPTLWVATGIATATIILASGYLVLKKNQNKKV